MLDIKGKCGSGWSAWLPLDRPIWLWFMSFTWACELHDKRYENGGSGSTIIASHNTDRICRTIELDPLYCDVIIKRYEDYTGTKSKLIKNIL